MSPLNLKWSVLVFLGGLVGSCIVGAAVYGADIFNPRLAVFQFVTSGAISGALAAAASSERRNVRWVIAALALVLFLAATRPNTGALLLRDLVYIPTLVASVWLAGVVCTRVPSSYVGRVVAWGIVFAACHFAMFGILTVANGAAFNSQIGYASARIGGLVGIGVGLGVIVLTRLGSVAEKSVLLTRDG